jgi:TolB-like protein
VIPALNIKPFYLGGNKMKRVLWFAFFAILATVTYAQTIDQAIENAAKELSGKLQANTSIVVLDFQAPTERLTNYVIDELNGQIVNIGRLKPVERRQLDAIRSELTFNASGDVSDESAQRIGHMLGSQYIITGSIETIATEYRIRFRAITVETASIIYTFSENIKNDKVLEALLAGSNTRLADFTSEQRVTASLLNLVFGLGSTFIQNDKKGGAVTATWEILGIVAMIAANVLYNIEASSDYYVHSGQPVPSFSETPYAYVQYGGIALYAVGAIYGIYRAQTYHKPGSQLSASPFNGFGLNLVSTDKKHTDLQLTYKMKF